MTLSEQLAGLDPALVRELRRYGFEPRTLERWAQSLGDGDQRNRVDGTVTPPLAEEILALPEPDSAEGKRLARLGMEALSRGELAFVVLAGGMATRMGGLVKALVEAIPGKSFLDLRLGEHAHWSKRAGAPVPLWLMTSHATDAAIRRALTNGADIPHVHPFPQNASLRLAEDGGLFFDRQGLPSVYATGHGDLPEALRKSALLSTFLQVAGRKHVWIANLDNLGASIDPRILGFHIERGAELTVEVVDKVGSDRGGIPVRWNERTVILEEFRLPTSFDPAAVRVFNTNTFLADARALASLAMDFTWLQVTKTVDDRRAIQHERLVGEVTTRLKTSFLRVPREGKESRFLPVKNNEELEARQADIAAIARARGML